MRRILIDSGILLSYYQQQEPLHAAVVAFFEQTAAQLITSAICIAEVLWLLGDPRDPRVLSVQNHLLGAVSRGGITIVDLLPEDYARIAALKVGDILQFSADQRGYALLTQDGITIGRLAQNFKSPTDLRCISARVHAIVVWRKRDSSSDYVERCKCNRWEVVVPELVFAP